MFANATASTPTSQNSKRNDAIAGRAAKDGHQFDVVIIDDDPRMVRLLAEVIESPAFDISTATDIEDGLQLVMERRPAVVLLDLIMPRVQGFEALDRIVAIDPGMDVMMITGHYCPSSAVEAIQRGAYDYITKPFSADEIRRKLNTWTEAARLRSHTARLDRDLIEAFQLGGIIGRSPAILEVFSRIRRIAPHFQTVVVTGETGTGKESAAKALHTFGPVSSGPFVVCNCAAIPENLFESELFGSVRGAFTGSTQDRPGFVQAANGGTLFLDEIGELPLNLQPKLPRLLQNRENQKLGSSRVERVDVRVVAATNRDLRTLVKERKLREDLYYRLSTVELRLPRLAERKEDLPMLQRHFLDLYASRFGKGRMNLTRRAQAAMSKYSWPGNVRELENVIAGCCMMVEGSLIDVYHFPESLRVSEGQIVEEDCAMNMAQMHAHYARRVLQQVNGNRARAASILAISRATLYRLLATPKG